MRKKPILRKVAILSYIMVAVMFMLFFLYMIVFEKVDIFQARSTGTYTAVQDYTVKDITDESAPAGIRKEYSWRFEDIQTDETSLVFYLVHHYAQVYFDDELVYSIMPDENNKISLSVSSNWVTVPIYREDSGKQVRVIVTPVYKSVTERNITFNIGSYMAIYLHQLKSDLPQIFLSGLCILLGIVMTLFQLCLIIQKKSDKWDMFYIGNFSALLGFWRLTDTRFSPLLFSCNTLVLGYITIGMLFIGIIPFALFMNERITRNNYNTKSPFLLLTIIASTAAVAVLLCQVFGIAEFKQTLIVCHIIIIIMALFSVLTYVLQGRNNKTRNTKAYKFILLISLGALLDIVFFYINSSSSGIIYTIVAFLIYETYTFLRNVMDIQRKAYNDEQTGLCNKGRWNQLMKNKSAIRTPIGIIMLDLNRLKYTNDTMGHEAGDKMIFNFSNILRNSIPHSNIICRWGGDEFTVFVTDADKEKMERYISAIESATQKYNESGEKPEIYFASGYVLSSEFEGLTKNELFKIADERMYQNKQKWYAENINITNE